jgi:hypothetical protein
MSNYMAVLPAPVRHRRNLSANAKLLYAELTTMTDKHGNCKVGNQVLMEIFETSERSVTRWLNELKNVQFISILQSGPERTITMSFDKKSGKNSDEARSPKLSTKVDKNVYQRSPKLSTNTLYTSSTNVEGIEQENFSSGENLNPDQPLPTPTLEDVVRYAECNGITKELATKFFLHYEAVDWEMKPGVFLKKWQYKLRGWKLEDLDREQKQQLRRPSPFGPAEQPSTYTSQAQQCDEQKLAKMRRLHATGV